MSINKWSPPAGGTGMDGNSAETLHPITYTPMRGVGGVEMGASYLHKFIYFFKFFTLNCLSIVVNWGKVTLGTSKNIVYFLYFKSQGKRRRVLFVFQVPRKTEILLYNCFRQSSIIKGEPRV